jgi:hypothetical protein
MVANSSGENATRRLRAIGFEFAVIALAALRAFPLSALMYIR